MGMADAKIWNPKNTTVGGAHAFFLVRGDASDYNLPADPQVPTSLLPRAWRSAALGGTALLLGAIAAFALSDDRRKTTR